MLAALPLHRLQLFKERVGALLLFIDFSRLVGQVPMTFDLGILQAIGPSAELTRDGFRLRFEI